ncbi:c(7)-type cytochrome triheme domain-containing protein [Sedimenticola sp.]|uniref:c(7)-type cytochrome triheme domain-containing protein n=1 Tax=Sedimenticola sp. TaxID=1940285 RepID=UPI003D12072D
MGQHGKARWFSLALFMTALWLAGPLLAEWTPLAEDGLHDPDNPALEVMQNPGDALSQLPRDDAGDVGNKVRWVQALEMGYIEPRTNILPETKIEVLDLDIIMKHTGSTAYVRFPHKPHTEWLDCSNCHEKIFKMKAGETPLSMLAILSGEYCGRCHGAVAFPLVLCNRCHSVQPDTLENKVNQRQ